MSQILTDGLVAGEAGSNPGGKGRVGALLLFVWTAMLLSVWGFAFIPTPQQSPEWVLQAQAACFGKLSNGLPAAQGWLLLILSPLAVISMIWASHAEELYEAPAAIKKSLVLKSIFVVLLALLLWVAVVTGKRISYAIQFSKIGAATGVSEPLPMNYPRLNQPAPDFQLINQKGEKVSQEVFRGKVTLLTFAFAHCSSICPMLIKTSMDAQKKVDSKNMQIVIMSIDPWRDTPASLPTLAKTWGVPEGSHFLSGEPDLVSKILGEYKITTARDLKTGDINHAGQIMVIDQEGKIAYSFLNPTSDWLATASNRLLK